MLGWRRSRCPRRRRARTPQRRRPQARPHPDTGVPTRDRMLPQYRNPETPKALSPTSCRVTPSATPRPPAAHEDDGPGRSLDKLLQVVTACDRLAGCHSRHAVAAPETRGLNIHRSTSPGTWYVVSRGDDTRRANARCVNAAASAFGSRTRRRTSDRFPQSARPVPEHRRPVDDSPGWRDRRPRHSAARVPLHDRLGRKRRPEVSR